MNLDVPKDTRYEIKFICYEDKYQFILNWIKLNQLNFFREYPSRIVNNVYFDSTDNKSYSDNISGISSRAKIRYRWYGKLDEDNYGNLEFKYKRNLFGWKKRFPIKKSLIKDRLNWKEIKNILSLNLKGNLKEFFKFNSNPQIINQYQRDYFLSFDRKIRITIDKNHKIYDQRMFRGPNLNKKKIAQNYLAIEFKFNRKDLNFYKSILDDFIPIQLSKNSKYINSIRAVMGI